MLAIARFDSWAPTEVKVKAPERKAQQMRLEGHPVVPDRAVERFEWTAVMLLRADRHLDEVAGTALEDEAYRHQQKAWRAWHRANPTTDEKDISWSWASQFEPYCRTKGETCSDPWCNIDVEHEYHGMTESR